jgi:hypothetical protein
MMFFLLVADENIWQGDDKQVAEWLTTGASSAGGWRTAENFSQFIDKKVPMTADQFEEVLLNLATLRRMPRSIHYLFDEMVAVGLLVRDPQSGQLQRAPRMPWETATDDHKTKVSEALAKIEAAAAAAERGRISVQNDITAANKLVNDHQGLAVKAKKVHEAMPDAEALVKRIKDARTAMDVDLEAEKKKTSEEIQKRLKTLDTMILDDAAIQAKHKSNLEKLKRDEAEAAEKIAKAEEAIAAKKKMEADLQVSQLQLDDLRKRMLKATETEKQLKDSLDRAVKDKDVVMRDLNEEKAKRQTAEDYAKQFQAQMEAFKMSIAAQAPAPVLSPDVIMGVLRATPADQVLSLLADKIKADLLAPTPGKMSGRATARLLTELMVRSKSTWRKPNDGSGLPAAPWPPQSDTDREVQKEYDFWARAYATVAYPWEANETAEKALAVAEQAKQTADHVKTTAAKTDKTLTDFKKHTSGILGYMLTVNDEISANNSPDVKPPSLAQQQKNVAALLALK